MYQPKVNNTQRYSDNQGEHIVHLGKLILLKGGLDKPNRLTIKGDFYNPIIISETDKEGGEGAWIYNSKSKSVYQIESEVILSYEYKILALPAHFSDKHLQAIVDGKMRDGDEVLVKCQLQYKTEYGDNKNVWQNMTKSRNEALSTYGIKRRNVVHLNQQNHITLFPAKQSLEEAAEDFVDKVSAFDGKDATHFNPLLEKSFKAGAEWVNLKIVSNPDHNKKALRFMYYALEFDAQRREQPWWRIFKRNSLRKKSESALELANIYMYGYTGSRSDVERVGIF